MKNDTTQNEQDRSGDKTDEWVAGEVGMSDAAGTSAAALLDSIRESLAQAPIHKRYDVKIEVTEHDQ